MNYQFFATAGIVSGFVAIVGIVFLILWGLSYDFWWSDTFTHVTGWGCGLCFIVIALFWLVVGIICGLSEIWGWGLVQS